jgi:hypothetical protein
MTKQQLCDKDRVVTVMERRFGISFGNAALLVSLLSESSIQSILTWDEAATKAKSHWGQ